MVLPSCTRCGERDPQRMHGLMTLWFGPLAELEADLGYFYLCPACHDELIVPELERIQNRILELHPAAQRHFDEMEDAAMEEAPTDEVPMEDTPLDEAPIDEAPIDDAPIDDAPIDDAPIDDAPESASPEDASPHDEDAIGEDDPSP